MRPIRVWLGGAIAAAVLVGVPTAGRAQSAPVPAAAFRIVNLSPGAPPQDFCANGELFQASVPFRDARGYAPLRAAELNSLTRLFAGDGCDGPVLNTTPFMLPPGSFISAVAIRRFEQISAIILRDDNSPPAPGFARVRFVNAAVDSGALDLSRIGGEVVFDDTAEESSGGYVTLAAGPLVLLARSSETGALVAATLTRLADGGVYTVFAAGIVGASGSDVSSSVRLMTVRDNADLPPATLCGDLALQSVELEEGRRLDSLAVAGTLSSGVDLGARARVQLGPRIVDVRPIDLGELFVSRALAFGLAVTDDGQLFARRIGDLASTISPNGQLTVRYRTAQTDAACIVRLEGGTIAR